MKQNNKNNDSQIIAALYKFSAISDDQANCEKIADALRITCQKAGTLGTLILAPEGVNGTICGPRDAIDRVLDHLRLLPGLADLEAKISRADRPVFRRMKVKVKSEIVTLKAGEIDVPALTGRHVTPDQWNQLIQSPETLVIDTRNTYELEVGRFKGAVSPETENFREFVDYIEQKLTDQKNRPIAMYCTGGIRCEKATAYMRAQGFKNVHQLDGGILKYLEETPKEQSLWEGECFVFDERVAVDQDLNPGSYALCRGCRHPITAEDKKYKVSRG